LPNLRLFLFENYERVFSVIDASCHASVIHVSDTVTATPIEIPTIPAVENDADGNGDEDEGPVEEVGEELWTDIVAVAVGDVISAAGSVVAVSLIVIKDKH